MSLVPFPKEPTAEFARELLGSVEDIIAGCQDDEWRASRADLAATRNPLYARHPRTKEFLTIATEVRMQLAMAFVHMHLHGYCPGDRLTNSREHDLQWYLLNSPVPSWVRHEVDLRAAAMPIPPDTRAWEIANALAESSNGFFTLATPRPPDVPMPHDHVYIRARQWYEHTCRGIAEGWYLEPENDA